MNDPVTIVHRHGIIEALVGSHLGDIQALHLVFQRLQKSAFSPASCLLLDIPLEPFSPLFLFLAAVHPFWLLVAKKTVNLQGSASAACGTDLIAFLAPETAGPAAIQAPRS